MRDAALKPHRAIIRPEWVDYNGHMSEAYYVLIFGDATDGFYDHIGLDDGFRRCADVSVYTVEAHIRYLSEGHEADALRVATRVLGYDTKRLRLHHEMQRDSDGTMLAITEISAVHIDKGSMRASPFHEPIYARIEAVARSQANLPTLLPAMSRHWAAATAQA